MTADPTIDLTFSHQIAKSDDTFLIQLDTVQPYDAMVEVKKWFSTYSHEWQTKSLDWPITINLFNGRATSNDKNRGFVPYLGELETVNFHQWNSRNPTHLKFRQGEPMPDGLERALWEIVAVEQVELERMNFSFTHASKNQVFRLQMRLAQIFNTVKILLKPWEDIARMHFENGYEILSHVPRDQRDASEEMLSSVWQEWLDNPPIWAK